MCIHNNIFTVFFHSVFNVSNPLTLRILNLFLQANLHGALVFFTSTLNCFTLCCGVVLRLLKPVRTFVFSEFIKGQKNELPLFIAPPKPKLI